jgi:hypothetical protein
MEKPMRDCEPTHKGEIFFPPKLPIFRTVWICLSPKWVNAAPTGLKLTPTPGPGPLAGYRKNKS